MKTSCVLTGSLFFQKIHFRTLVFLTSEMSEVWEVQGEHVGGVGVKNVVRVKPRFYVPTTARVGVTSLITRKGSKHTQPLYNI